MIRKGILSGLGREKLSADYKEAIKFIVGPSTSGGIRNSEILVRFNRQHGERCVFLRVFAIDLGCVPNLPVLYGPIVVHDHLWNRKTGFRKFLSTQGGKYEKWKKEFEIEG
jgi:hypothetical protein